MSKNYSIILFFLLLTLFVPKSLLAQEEYKKLYQGQFAPEFSVKDIQGNLHSISKYKGTKILLSFYRNAGCPVCNYRFHELEDNRGYFEEKGLILLSVYESSVENLKLLIDTNHFYQQCVADPEGALYNLYAVELNKGKIAKGFLHGAKQKAYKGKQRFSKAIKQDGKIERIAADFLIDENGNILATYYGKYLGDRMPIEQIKKLLQ
jgi:thioredoxin-dependent peroxiredoxin